MSWIKTKPKYEIGQEVITTVTTFHTPTSKEFTNELRAFISTIAATNDKQGKGYKYGLVVDLPGSSTQEGGKVFTWVLEDNINLVKKT